MGNVKVDALRWVLASALGGLLRVSALGMAGGDGGSAEEVAEVSRCAAPGSWSTAKDCMDDKVYFDRDVTGYCGCPFVSHGDDDGSGDIGSHAQCGYEVEEKWQEAAEEVQWEHVVPKSLTPARHFDCWTGEHGDADRCIRDDPEARAMILDPHNLIPSVGQVNQYRGNLRYGEIPSGRGKLFGECPVQVTEDTFEPPDCRKGDVARIWFYMADRYGVRISNEERRMFDRWSQADPVSPWELTRAERIASFTGKRNQFVQEAEEVSKAGTCN